ncbi:hypothetical protein SAMN02787142_7721 [Burkholderia sp. WP9]|uniref:hypothetical protein n=1 Tax=Burkholderia sp. WP9 TaxID=1500263 RepID=UPI000896F145|nr:hypothetical protein [Burkholderia sp. WP9]SEF11553.1 hypothetical protein SAMN02787142_7721 [Burkholderia sp. WP9]
MERFFMTRASAIAYLLKARRAMPDEIEDLRVRDADMRLQELDAIDRLLIDVRAGRTREFRVAMPLSVEIAITD